MHSLLLEHAHEQMRELLTLFHLSHAVLFVNAAHRVDLSLLRTLRVLATLKQTIQPVVSQALKPISSQLAPHRSNAPAVFPVPPVVGVIFDGSAVLRAAAAAAMAMDRKRLGMLLMDTFIRYPLPPERLEASEIDGAGFWAKQRFIVIPHLRSLIVFILLISARARQRDQQRKHHFT